MIYLNPQTIHLHYLFCEFPSPLYNKFALAIFTDLFGT